MIDIKNEVDINNNHDPFNTSKEFNKETRSDSGLEVITPKSNESLSFSVPDQNGNHYVSMPQNNNETCVTEIPSRSLNFDKAPTNDIIEMKVDDIQNIDKPTIIVIYQQQGKTKHFQLSDSRGLKRSQTFSETPNDNNLIKSSFFPFSSQNPITTPENDFHNISPSMKEPLCIIETKQNIHTPKIQTNSIHKKGGFPQLLSCFNFCKCIITKLKKNSGAHNNIDSDGSVNYMKSTEYSDEYDDVIEDDSARIWYDSCEEVEFCDSGGQSVVYKAVLNGNPVILKTVKRLDNIDMRKMLELNHENVVKFLGYSIREPSNKNLSPTNYLVMEMCDKRKLYEFIQLRDFEINPCMIYEWINQICDGMVYLHSHGVIHRDLKSLNILMKDSVLKIVDFRVEKSPSSCNLDNNNLNSVVGTYPWMSPEALQSSIPTNKMDIWSFGVIIWELITRKIPFENISEYAIIIGVPDGTLELPIPENIPHGLRNLLNDCWKIDPVCRPSFLEIKERLPSSFREMNGIQPDAFVKLQEEWAVFVEKKYQTMSKSQMSIGKIEQEMIRKRNDELRDAKEIKNVYKEKVARVETLINKLKCATLKCDLHIKFNEFLRLNRDVEKKFQEFCNEKIPQCKADNKPNKRLRSSSRPIQQISLNPMCRSANNDPILISRDSSRNQKTKVFRKASQPVNINHFYRSGLQGKNKKDKIQPSTSQSCETLNQTHKTHNAQKSDNEVKGSPAISSPRNDHIKRQLFNKPSINLISYNNPSFNSSIDSLKNPKFLNKHSNSSHRYHNDNDLDILSRPDSLVTSIMASSIEEKPGSESISQNENSQEDEDNDSDEVMQDGQKDNSSEDHSHQSPPMVILRNASGRQHKKWTHNPPSQIYRHKMDLLPDSFSTSLTASNVNNFDTLQEKEQQVEAIIGDFPTSKANSRISTTRFSNSNRDSYTTNIRPRTTISSDINMWSPNHT